ncbi:MAG: arginase [Deltaproteobacteria bacterium]|nr:MAG: arginase [Deltaproteobacteria bacterium]
MDLSITNVHLDLGAGRRGTDMGPSAMHVAGLVPRLREIGHQIGAVHNVDTRSFEQEPVGDAHARFLSIIHDVCGRLTDHVHEQVGRGRFPLVLGGDHSQAIGTIAGLARHHRPRGERIGVLWVDAHTDMNTPETSPSGNIHGMPLATLLGRGAPELVALAGNQPALYPEDVVVFGARDVDPTEAPLVRELGVRVYTMSEIDRRGTAACAVEALEHIGRHTVGIHLSFDLDGVDPTDAPGVGTPVSGGLSLRESHMLCELVSQTGKLLGMEMVELNPILDERNRTGQLAVWLILSALGKTIL